MVINTTDGFGTVAEITDALGMGSTDFEDSQYGLINREGYARTEHAGFDSLSVPLTPAERLIGPVGSQSN